MTPPDALLQLGLRERVDQELRAFVEEEIAQLVAIDEELEPVAAQLRVATAHGKRLRAAFCYWGWRAAGGPDSEALVRAAASMELVHAAAVVHDDVIDSSGLRHGLPTAHRALLRSVRRQPRAPAAARSLAVLVGDLLMAWAGQMFAHCGLPAAYLGRARPLWTVLARELVAGECLEVLRTGNPPDTAASMQVIRYKTAKYTVEHPLLIGGALAGAALALRDAYSAYGVPLGEAFQLRDDLLGLFGDPRRTGKSTGDDLTARRPTVLLALAWQHAGTTERGVLEGFLRRRELTDAEVRHVREVIRGTGAPQRVEDMIAERVRTATAVLGRTPVPPQAARALTELARTATARSG
ncbi:polyprenyl synthetase family protein [Streptomyces albus subsp. chlorinus]|uniref:polyprenyl synthetase family protein n=1 Tax=Streptomyces albus TaxID=1888 RepID=UPI00156E4897|nr:polyprenyl synthetase family protein [Streptomyces albus]NSC20032.1 polyprenyl synthetase family protein [Streptomyces albus subsp. chlorinus]